MTSSPALRVLRVDCTDQPGLIHAITGVLSRRGANIVTNDEFVDTESNRFFMRTALIGGGDVQDTRRELMAHLPSDAIVTFAGDRRPRIVVLATREHHCLGELLIRHAHDELGATIDAVISNRPVLQSLTERFGLPFIHLPHEGLSREAHEAALLDRLAAYPVDYVVLAKYMRVLSPLVLAAYAGRIVNIHHSFLPAFVGANPYRQAYDRGVKIIGATAHFVTEALDEGPIIAQAVVPVDHSCQPEAMARAGRDVEKIVLAKALQLVFESRVFLSGHRTIVFD